MTSNVKNAIACAIEDMAEFATDPENLARLDPKAASEMRRYLGKLLGRPNDSLEELARALAVEAKKRAGIFQN